jgi:formiminoglutamase
MNSDTEIKVVEIVQGDSPLVLGIPHTGTYVPTEIFNRLNDTGKHLADTDWHVHRLYDGLGDNVTSVRALFHRYVIDANRDPSGMSLYPGQNTTGLCPTIDFDDNDIYQKGQDPKAEEIEERRLNFHQKYHDALAAEIERVKANHGFAILYDCHSIRSHIPHLFDGKLPDFNIGTFNGKSCSDIIAKTVEKICADAPEYTHVLNGRFKGGWTTRHYGEPKNNVHALQMELAQSTYMEEDAPWTYLPDVADKIRPHLQAILCALSK